MIVNFTENRTNMPTEFDMLKIQEIEDRGDHSVIHFLDDSTIVIKENGSEIDKHLKACKADCFIRLTKCQDNRKVYCNTFFVTIFRNRTGYSDVQLRNGIMYFVKESADKSSIICGDIYSKVKDIV